MTLDFQVVLIVKFEKTQQWPEGEAQLFDQICRQANSLLTTQSARQKLYWIAIFGPHWRYGINLKEDDGLLELPSLIPWHNTTHDNASLDDLETLAGLVRAI